MNFLTKENLKPEKVFFLLFAWKMVKFVTQVSNLSNALVSPKVIVKENSNFIDF